MPVMIDTEEAASAAVQNWLDTRYEPNGRFRVKAVADGGPVWRAVTGKPGTHLGEFCARVDKATGVVQAGFVPQIGPSAPGRLLADDADNGGTGTAAARFHRLGAPVHPADPEASGDNCVPAVAGQYVDGSEIHRQRERDVILLRLDRPARFDQPPWRRPLVDGLGRIPERRRGRRPDHRDSGPRRPGNRR